ncbi:uncharacterized protein BJ212DRAFT_1297483 [Suillus subaureus]|uniref:Uncharacterized protein n=1 Tax=Suillus subaureus TaxID=48587 RepID=A0A9P7EH10_9AGAM|nr:uncharacterized protein BJ212DRAFT_1297483 [Suillus subaureus]KAG1821029.1 hypothetical protein BJ212DRAFT_1297483 [Suillus subaureus]
MSIRLQSATVLVAIFSFFYTHDPNLTEPERSYTIDMLKQDLNHLSPRFDNRFVWQAMKDLQDLTLLVPGYAIALFSPTIINELGYSAANDQLHIVPPFVAGAIATIIVGIYSGKHNLRGSFIIGAYERACRSSELSLAAAGNYPTVLVILTWAGSNAGGDLKRGVVLAMVIGINNLGSVCSSFIYIDPPRFHNWAWHQHGIPFSFNRNEPLRYCLVENITDDRRYEFQDMGDASPLYSIKLVGAHQFRMRPATRISFQPNNQQTKRVLEVGTDRTTPMSCTRLVYLRHAGDKQPIIRRTKNAPAGASLADSLLQLIVVK